MFSSSSRRAVRPWVHGVICAAALAVPATSGHAARGGRAALHAQAGAALQQFRTEQPEADCTVDAQTGLVRSMQSLHVRGTRSGSPVENARAFVTRHRKMLLGDRSVEDLQPVEARTFLGTRHVTFRQFHKGLPVFGATLSVHIDAQGDVRAVQNSVQPEIETGATPVLTAEQAIRLAWQATGQAELRGRPRAELGVLVIDGACGLIYRVTVPTAQPADWTVIVDARSGAVLSAFDLLTHVSGQGVVVDQNLFKTPQTVTRPFDNLNGSGILKGDYADVFSATSVDGGPKLTGVRLSQSKENQFTAGTPDPRFDEQMLYYHVNRVHDYFSRTFGFTKRDSAIPVVAHMPEIKDGKARAMNNAFFSGQTDALYFGDGSGAKNGGINATSRDADVVYHEFTHAVIFKIVPNLNGETAPNVWGGSLNEAYADYFSCTILDDPALGEYTVDKAEGLRNLVNGLRFPNDINPPRSGAPEVHWTGQIWGGALWDLRQQIGAQAADQIIFHSLFYLPTDGKSNFQSAFEAVLAADWELYEGSHEAAIRQAMAKHGLPGDPANNNTGSTRQPPRPE